MPFRKWLVALPRASWKPPLPNRTSVFVPSEDGDVLLMSQTQLPHPCVCMTNALPCPAPVVAFRTSPAVSSRPLGMTLGGACCENSKREKKNGGT